MATSPEQLELPAINEAIAGTFDALREELERAARLSPDLFGAREAGEIYVRDVSLEQDWVVICNWEAGRLYQADFSRGDNEQIVFSNVVEVEEETTLNPVNESAPDQNTRRRAFTETVENAFEVVESGDGKAKRIRATGITADVVNANYRRYPRAVLQQAVSDLQGQLTESRVQGRVVLLGEVEHPSDKPTGRPNLLETVVKWDVVGIDAGGRVMLEGDIIPTPGKGEIVQMLLEHGVPIGISQRAYGESQVVKDGGRHVEEVTALTITAYDLVMEPSDPNGGVESILENKRRIPMEELLNLIESPEFRATLAESVRAQIDAALKAKDEARRDALLREALGANEGEDMLEAARKLAAQTRPEDRAAAELREALGIEGDTDALAEARRIVEENTALLAEKRQREVQAYIAEVTEGIEGYPDKFKEAFREAVEAAKPESVETAKALVEAKRAEYDKLVAAAQLGARGFGNGVSVDGSVLESETGVPEFARAAFTLTESLVKSGHAKPRKLNRPAAELSPSERFTLAMLERFDTDYRPQLMAEARLFGEAETTVDLNLPYSVARAIAGEVGPQLVSPNVFDFGVTDSSNMRIFYEQYVDETGVQNAVTGEDMTVAALGAWVNLSNKRIQPGSIVVEPDGGGAAYTEGSDYVVDCANGRIMALEGGTMTASPTTYDVDYRYDAMRKGEMQPIERGKKQLVSKALEIAADRLAVQISNEAIAFSRSQLGYDALARAVAGVIERSRRKKDQDVFHMGLAAMRMVPNNNSGTWPLSTPAGTEYQDHLDTLLRYIGAAKVLLQNRYYEPTSIVCSIVMADMLGNSNKWNRPDVDIDAAGYMGRVKGLPIFAVATEQFTDGFIAVVNRELVIHRVFSALKLDGPHQSHSSSDGKLVAAREYYVEEFNGTDAPVPEKGAFVTIK